jgi:hypothetical protein
MSLSQRCGNRDIVHIKMKAPDVFYHAILVPFSGTKEGADLKLLVNLITSVVVPPNSNEQLPQNYWHKALHT